MNFRSKSLFAVIAIAGLGLAACSGGKDIPGDPADVEAAAGNWVLLTGETPRGELVPVMEPITLDLMFGEEDGFSASAGCNQLFGDAQLAEPGKLKLGPIASTKMMCEEDIMNAETAYSEALEAVDHASIDGETLILSGKKTQLEFSRVTDDESASAGGTQDAAEVAGNWELQSGESAGTKIAPIGGEAILFSIEPDGSASATVGCNQLGAQVDVASDSEISIQGTFSTLMACEDDLMQLETDYLSALEAVKTFILQDGRLQLSGDDVELDFSAQ